MTESSDTSPERPETAEGTAQTPSSMVAGVTPPGQYPPGMFPGSYPPPPWPHSSFPPPPTVTPTVTKNGLGIASLVIAIIALIFVWSVLGGVIGGIVAVVLGIAGRGRVKRGEANNGGVAIAGIALGLLAVVVGLAFIALWAGFWQYVGGADYVDCIQNAGSDPIRQQQCTDEFRQHLEEKFNVTLTPTPLP
jgi:hypothetical protein